MHELGIVFRCYQDHPTGRAGAGTAKCSLCYAGAGGGIGAVPHELESCWDWAVKRTELMPAAKLRIETIPAVTHCGECGQDYSTVPQGRSCPYCGSEETWLIRGDEINIKEIEAI